MASGRPQQCRSRCAPGVLSFFSNPVLLMAAWRARQGSISRPARAIWPNKWSRREWMVSDRGGTCAMPRSCVGHMLTVIDTEDDAGPIGLKPKVNLGWHCLCHCPGLCSIQKDRLDIYRVKAKIGGHRYTGAPDIAIQLCHTVPRDCYLSDQLFFTPAITVNHATRVGKWLKDVYGIVSHLNMLRNWRDDCCVDFILPQLISRLKGLGSLCIISCDR